MDGHTVSQFGTGIDLDDIPDEFDGKGHRLKVKEISFFLQNL